MVNNEAQFEQHSASKKHKQVTQEYEKIARSMKRSVVDNLVFVLCKVF